MWVLEIGKCWSNSQLRKVCLQAVLSEVSGVPDCMVKMESTQPLRELLSTKWAWLWGPEQEQAFCRINDSSAVQPLSWVENISRCILIWVRSIALPERWRQMETCGLCIQVYVRNQKEICSNREKSPSSDLGMWEVYWLHLRAEVSDWIRPQGIDTTSEHQTAGQYATTNSEIQSASSEVWLLSMPCPWQTL